VHLVYQGREVAQPEPKAIISTDPTDRRQLRELGRRIAAIARACKRTARSR